MKDRGIEDISLMMKESSGKDVMELLTIETSWVRRRGVRQQRHYTERWLKNARFTPCNLLKAPLLFVLCKDGLGML